MEFKRIHGNGQEMQKIHKMLVKHQSRVLIILTIAPPRRLCRIQRWIILVHHKVLLHLDLLNRFAGQPCIDCLYGEPQGYSTIRQVYRRRGTLIMLKHSLILYIDIENLHIIKTSHSCRSFWHRWAFRLILPQLQCAGNPQLLLIGILHLIFLAVS